MRYFFIFLFAITSSSLSAQTIDQYKTLYSKEKNISKKAYYATLLRLSEGESPDGSWEKVIEQAKKRDALGEAVFDMQTINAAIVNNQPAPPISEIERTKKILQTNGFIDICDNLDVCVAFALAQKGKFAEASFKYEDKYQIIKKKYFQKKTDFLRRENFILITMSIAYHYFKVGDAKKAVFYVEKLIQDAEITKNPIQYCVTLTNVGTAYSSAKEYQKSLFCYDKAILVSLKNNLITELNWIHYCKANVYSKIGDFQNAYNELNQITYSNTGNGKVFDNIDSDLVELSYAKVFYEFKKPNDTEQIIDRLIAGKSDESYLNPNDWEQVYELKYRVSKDKKNINDALKYHEIWQKLKSENLHETEKDNKAVQKSFMSFEQERLKETLNAKSENKLNSLRVRNQFIIISFLFLTAIVFLFLLFRFYKLNKKLRASSKENKVFTQKIEESLAEKEVMLKEIHHRVKNNFQIISSLLNIQSAELNDEKYLNPLALARNRVYSMSLVHQKLYSIDSNYRAINFQEYLPELVDSLRTNFGMEPKKVITQFHLPELLIPLEKAVTLGLLCNEIFTNSFKYAIDVEGILQLSIEGKKINNTIIELRIRDFGPGFSDEPYNSSSIGHQLKDILTQQLEGTIENFNENGAVVKITFPL